VSANIRCAVCGAQTPDVRNWETHSGTRYGMACRGKCACLLWEAHFTRVTDSNEFEHALVLWKWQRRRAEASGVAFVVPPPSSEVEKLCSQQQALWGAA